MWFASAGLARLSYTRRIGLGAYHSAAVRPLYKDYADMVVHVRDYKWHNYATAMFAV
jgi:hypothetical protein